MGDGRFVVRPSKHSRARSLIGGMTCSVSFSGLIDWTAPSPRPGSFHQRQRSSEIDFGLSSASRSNLLDGAVSSSVSR